MLDSPGGVNRMLDSPRVTRELRLTHSADANSRNGEEDSAKGHGTSSACAHREVGKACGECTGGRRALRAGRR